MAVCLSGLDLAGQPPVCIYHTPSFAVGTGISCRCRSRCAFRLCTRCWAWCPLVCKSSALRLARGSCMLTTAPHLPCFRPLMASSHRKHCGPVTHPGFSLSMWYGVCPDSRIPNHLPPIFHSDLLSSNGETPAMCISGVRVLGWGGVLAPRTLGAAR